MSERGANAQTSSWHTNAKPRQPAADPAGTHPPRRSRRARGAAALRWRGLHVKPSARQDSREGPTCRNCDCNVCGGATTTTKRYKHLTVWKLASLKAHRREARAGRGRACAPITIRVRAPCSPRAVAARRARPGRKCSLDVRYPIPSPHNPYVCALRACAHCARVRTVRVCRGSREQS